MLKDRLLSALLAVAVSLAVCVAIVRFTPAAPEFSPAQLEQGLTYAAIGVPGGETVATVDGKTAPAELLTYQIGYSCAYLDYMLRSYNGEGLDFSKPLSSGSAPKETVLSESLELVKQQLVLENLAEQYGVTLSPEQETALAEQRAAEIEHLGFDNYLAEIYKLGLSRDGYDRVQRAGALYQAFYDAYITPGSVLYADDASKNSLKRVFAACEERGVPVKCAGRSKEALSAALGRLCAVLSVEDRGFADKLCEMIDDCE